MSSNLVPYKTIFIAPNSSTNSELGFVADSDDTIITAYAQIFLPLDDSISEIRVLAGGDAGTVFTLGLYALDGNTTRTPSLSDIGTIATTALSYDTATLTTGTEWLKFSLDAVLANKTNYYAIVITADSVNAIIHSNTSTNDNLLGIKTTVDSGTTWTSKQQGNSALSMNLLIYGDQLSSTNVLDSGFIASAGPDRDRGTALYVVVKNEGTTTSKNIVMYAADGGTSQLGTADETYLAGLTWYRYTKDNLPSFTNVESGLVESLSSPLGSLATNELCLFVQPNRFAPLPVVYFEEASQIFTTDQILDESDTSLVTTAAATGFNTRTNAVELIYTGTTITAIDENNVLASFVDSDSNPIDSDTVITGNEYIRVQTGTTNELKKVFTITGLSNDKLTATERNFPLYFDQGDGEEKETSTIDGVTGGYFSQVIGATSAPLYNGMKIRIYDGNLNLTDNELRYRRLMPSGENAKFIVNNTSNTVTMLGDVLLQGTASSVSATELVTGTSIVSTTTRGLTDNDVLNRSASNSLGSNDYKGKLLIAHDTNPSVFAIAVNTSDQIITDGRVVDIGTIDSVTDNGDGTFTITDGNKSWPSTTNTLLTSTYQGYVNPNVAQEGMNGGMPYQYEIIEILGSSVKVRGALEAGVNLLRNPSFEDGIGVDTITYWTLATTGTSNTAARESTPREYTPHGTYMLTLKMGASSVVGNTATATSDVIDWESRYSFAFITFEIAALSKLSANAHTISLTIYEFSDAAGTVEVQRSTEWSKSTTTLPKWTTATAKRGTSKWLHDDTVAIKVEFNLTGVTAGALNSVYIDKVMVESSETGTFSEWVDYGTGLIGIKSSGAETGTQYFVTIRSPLTYGSGYDYSPSTDDYFDLTDAAYDTYTDFWGYAIGTLTDDGEGYGFQMIAPAGHPSLLPTAMTKYSIVDPLKYDIDIDQDDTAETDVVIAPGQSYSIKEYPINVFETSTTTGWQIVRFYGIPTNPDGIIGAESYTTYTATNQGVEIDLGSGQAIKHIEFAYKDTTSGGVSFEIIGTNDTWVNTVILSDLTLNTNDSDAITLDATSGWNMALIDLNTEYTVQNIIIKQTSDGTAKINNFRIYPEDDINDGGYAIFGSAKNSRVIMDAIDDADDCTFEGNGSFVIVDLGMEYRLSEVSFNIQTLSGVLAFMDGSTMQVSAKQTEETEFEVIENVHFEKPDTSTITQNVTVELNKLTRYIKLAWLSTSRVRVGSFSVKVTDISTTYLSSENSVYNLEGMLNDSKLSTSSVPVGDPSTVTYGVMKGENAAILVKYSADVPITKVQFNAFSSGRALFEVQYSTATEPTTWVTIKKLFTSQYQSIPASGTTVKPSTKSISDGYGTKLKDSNQRSAFANNALAGWTIRPDEDKDFYFTVVSSEDDGTYGIVTVDADLRDYIDSAGTYYIAEKANIIEFPYVLASNIRIKQLTDHTTRINNLKVFSPLLSASGATVTPQSNLQWKIQISSV